MNDLAFRALLSLHMANDPTILPMAQEKAIEELLDAEAGKRGYDGWVVAYHEMPCTEAATS